MTTAGDVHTAQNWIPWKLLMTCSSGELAPVVVNWLGEDCSSPTVPGLVEHKLCTGDVCEFAPKQSRTSAMGFGQLCVKREVGESF